MEVPPATLQSPEHCVLLAKACEHSGKGSAGPGPQAGFSVSSCVVLVEALNNSNASFLICKMDRLTATYLDCCKE